MSEFKNILTRTEYRNWMKCSFAQIIVKNVLDYVVALDIDDLQRQILETVRSSKQIPPNTICNQCLTPNILPCPTRKICPNNVNCSFHDDIDLQPRLCPTNGLCNAIHKEIIGHHRFRGPSWKNTDSSKWCTVSWTIAKCFMPPDGYENANSADETDFNGILNIMINCIEFQNKFSEDFNSSTNVCNKARDNSRRLRHSPTMTMTEDEMNNFIDTLIDILNDPQFFQSDDLSIECRTKLEKLKTDALDVSAADVTTTLQDAVLSMQCAVKRLGKDDLTEENRDSLLNLQNLADNVHTLSNNVKLEIQKALNEQNSQPQTENDESKRCTRIGFTKYFTSPYNPALCSFIFLTVLMVESNCLFTFFEFIWIITSISGLLDLMSSLSELGKSDFQKIKEIQETVEAVQKYLLDILEKNKDYTIM